MAVTSTAFEYRYAMLCYAVLSCAVFVSGANAQPTTTKLAAKYNYPEARTVT